MMHLIWGASDMAGRGRGLGTLLEGKLDGLVAKVGLELGGDVDHGGPPRGVLHHQEELGDYLDHVARLQDKVALPHQVFGPQTTRYVGLAAHLHRRT